LYIQVISGIIEDVQPKLPSQLEAATTCKGVFIVRSLVFIKRHQSAILLWQIRPSVCPSRLFNLFFRSV